MTLRVIILPTEHLTFGLPKLPCASCYVQVLCAICFAQVALRKRQRSVQVALRKCCRSLSGSTSHRSCRTVLRVLQLYLKVAIFQPELHPRTTFALKSCDFCLEKLPRTRRGSKPRPRDSESSAHHATASKDYFASNKFARRHSESASTRTILAEVRASIFRIEKPSVFAPRPSQTVPPGMSKTQKSSAF